MSLQIQTTRVEPDIVVVHLSGSITSGPESQAVVEPLVRDLLNQSEKKLIFDLTGVEETDSTGLKIIIHCFLAARTAGAELRLASASAKPPPAKRRHITVGSLRAVRIDVRRA